MTTTHDKAVHARECKGSIPIVPFRYAVMPKIEGDSTQYYYDTCPTKLDKGFGKLDTAAYSIRTLRPGYIYLYDEDLGTTYLWEADGEGNYVSLAYTYLEKYPVARRGSPMANITVCDESNDVYIVYSQDLWTENQAAKNIKNRKDFMVKLNIQEILNGSGSDSTQENVLPSGAPEEWIEEYKTDKDDYKAQFSWSSFKPDNIVGMANLKTLATPYAVMHQPKLPLYMVLYDNVATAIDLGNIAALHMHQLYDIKNKQKSVAAKTRGQQPKNQSQPLQEVKTVPFEMELDTSNLKTFSSTFYRKKMVADIIESALKASYPSEEELKKEGSNLGSLKDATRLAKETLKYSKGRQNPRIVGEKEASLYVLSNPHVNKEASSLTKHIKMDELKKFSQEWDEEYIRMNAITEKVLEATNDHKTVLLTMTSEAALPHPRHLLSTIGTYDRDNVITARELELAIARCINGIGIPVPGKAEIDQRFKLLENWIENENSPLFIALFAYNPFKDKLNDFLNPSKAKVDSEADLLGGIGMVAEELYKKFPYTVGTTLIVNDLKAITFKKMRGKTRWNKSASVLKNVDNAVKGGMLKKLIAAIQGRYAITGQVIESHNVTRATRQIINLNNDVARRTSKAVDIKGTRTTTVSQNTITTASREASSMKVMKSIGASGLSGGIAFMHMINLGSASESFLKDDSLANSLNLGSAIFGFAGAFNELTVVNVKLMQSVQKMVYGKAAKAAVVSSATSKLSGPLALGAAVFESFLHISSAWKYSGKGDTDAAVFSSVAAIGLGGAGGIMTALAFGAMVPGIGWAAAIVGLTAMGIGAFYMAMTVKDKPMEVWASRTVFGIPRRSRFGFGKEADTPFNNLVEELNGYYDVTFSPIMLPSAPSKKDNNGNDIAILSPAAETNWLEHGAQLDEVKFTFLLPGYIEGTSDWEYHLNSYDADDLDEENAAEMNIDGSNPNAKYQPLNSKKMIAYKETKQENEGMYVYLDKVLRDRSAESASVKITYWPKGESGREVINTFFADESIF